MRDPLQRVAGREGQVDEIGVPGRHPQEALLTRSWLPWATSYGWPCGPATVAGGSCACTGRTPGTGSPAPTHLSCVVWPPTWPKDSVEPSCSTRPPGGTSGPGGPGILVLDGDLAVLSVNPAAERWLADITDADWAGTAELPVAVYAAVARLAQLEADHQSAPDAPSIRLCTGSGQWLALHASRLYGPGGGHTAVVLEAASPTQLASMFLDAHGLTPAQARVAGLVLQSRSTNEIVDELGISRHTVQEHLKAVFDKLGVRSRRELVAALLVKPS
ncbi:MAG: helix-turn-helix transcriptional regulator [Acidimicrobiales bacterium]